MASLLLGWPGSFTFLPPCSVKWKERGVALAGRQSRRLRRRCQGVATLLVVLALFGSNFYDFAAPKQEPLHLRREQQGLAVSSPTGKDFDVAVNYPGVTIEVTSEEKKLLSRIKGVREEEELGQWNRLQTILASYKGVSPVVVNAGMRAAFRCHMYQEGVKMFERLRQAEAPLTSPVYTTAMKLYGKLHRLDEVRKLWQELVVFEHVDEVSAQACIDANADNGNITGAAEVLEYMENESISMNVQHFTSAINACAKSKETYRAKASKFLLGRMKENNQRPNIVTYSCVVSSMSLSPAQHFLDLLSDMKVQSVPPDKVFAERFFYTFFNSPPGRRWNTIAADLQKVPSPDLKIAKKVMDVFVAAGIDLSAFCKQIKKVLESLL